jgi:hypothetical protein
MCHVDVYISIGNPSAKADVHSGSEHGRMVLTEDVLVYVYMYTVKLEALPLGQGMYRESFTVCDVDVAITNVR